jgi:hypothetical protein
LNPTNNSIPQSGESEVIRNTKESGKEATRIESEKGSVGIMAANPNHTWRKK